MKPYLATTGVLFVALAAAHVVRGFQEPHLVRDPWFVVTTILSLVLAAWALRLYMKARAPKQTAV